MNAAAGADAGPVSALDLPIGGSRYRPSLADVIEFCILERLVDAREGWEEQLRAARQSLHAQQLTAAVRSDPRAAAETLCSLGWAVDAR